jgi:hypothetical protein
VVARTRGEPSSEDYSTVSDPADYDDDAEDTPDEFEGKLGVGGVDLTWDGFDERKYNEESHGTCTI